MAIAAFSNFNITVSDGGTVPPIDYLTNKTYVDIGSGNVLKISWNTPTATNNAIDFYTIYISYFDSTTLSYLSLCKVKLGNINEFYIKSSLLSSIKQSFIPVKIYVEAFSRYGNSYNGTSNVCQVDISRGCGTYTRVTDGYSAPIMKRSLAFTKLDYLNILAADGPPLADNAGNSLFSKRSSVQDATSGWTLMQEFLLKSFNKAALTNINNEDHGLPLYTKGTEEVWVPSDISYEVLTDANGEIITDLLDESIYVL